MITDNIKTHFSCAAYTEQTLACIVEGIGKFLNYIFYNFNDFSCSQIHSIPCFPFLFLCFVVSLFPQKFLFISPNNHSRRKTTEQEKACFVETFSMKKYVLKKYVLSICENGENRETQKWKLETKNVHKRKQKKNTE